MFLFSVSSPEPDNQIKQYKTDKRKYYKNDQLTWYACFDRVRSKIVFACKYVNMVLNLSKDSGKCCALVQMHFMGSCFSLVSNIVIIMALMHDDVT